MASQIFGTSVRPEHVIGETLVRTTSSLGLDGQFLQQLIERVREGGQGLPHDYQSFIQDPLSIWIESTFGVTEREDRLVRTTPKSIPPLLDMSLQVLVAMPLYIALMWLTLILVRALVRTIRRREPVARLAGE